MNTANLIKRILFGGKTVGVKVPLCFKPARKDNIDLGLIPITDPRIAITCNHAGLIITVLFPELFSHLARIVENPDVIVAIEIAVICRMSDLQHIVKKSDISI